MIRMYRVGGAVRDQLMGHQPQDVDYVVTGVTEKQLLAARPFGETLTKIEAQNFPVYHDSKGNEWALARRERKEGSGYHGFAVEFGSEVTQINGKKVRTLNPELLKKFMDSGFEPRVDYPIEQLIEFFRSIDQ